jgi:hypothetical protein
MYRALWRSEVTRERIKTTRTEKRDGGRVMASNEGAAPLHAWRGGREEDSRVQRGIIIQVKKQGYL